MKTLSIVMVILIVLTVSIHNISADTTNSCGYYGNRVELNYTIDGGSVKAICFNADTYAIQVYLSTTHNGTITLDVPRNLLNTKDTSCTFDIPFFVMINKEKINDKEILLQNLRSLIIPFNKGDTLIEIHGITPGTSDSSINKNCQKIVISSPLQQYKSGIKTNNVKCDNNLQLVIKAEDGHPACVKPGTANILIERGWAKNN